MKISATLLLVLLLPALGAGKLPASEAPTGAGSLAHQHRSFGRDIVPGVVALKITSATVAQSLVGARSTTGLASLDGRLQRFGATRVQKMFRHRPISWESGAPDISRILKVEIPEHLDPVVVARELARDPNVEYAEPLYVRRLCEVPNDPRYPEQHHLPQIHAPEAWGVEQGDSTVILAIVDTGVDCDHEDLAANIWTNAAEASGAAGVDDDGNGYVDDIHGWDFGDEDADPTDPSTELGGHGTHCAGIACAVTNNQRGVAGVSWHCRVMPVKISPDENSEFLTHPFEGIIYAADNGADVISASWGGFGYSQMEEEVLAYAHARGAVVVCAAGNDNREDAFYPSAYRNAISVAAVKVNDTKTSYSNFGPWVDICAPGGDQGAQILSTIPDDRYEAWSGTSMATPVVAGVCALVQSRHPDWDHDQIIRQVLLSADNVDPFNPQFRDRLGHGRVNAFRAVTETGLEEPDARLAVMSYTVDDSTSGNNNRVLERGETIHLRCSVRNFSIGGTSTASLQLSSSSAGLEILDGTSTPPLFAADTTLLFDFTLKVTDDAPAELADILLALGTARGYSREEHVELTVGSMPLLLVDNDRAAVSLPDVESAFRNVLDDQQILYGYWDAQKLGFPGSVTLQHFPTAMISTVWLWNFVNDDEQRAVKEYLEGDNNLFMCGQDIGEVLWEVLGTEPDRAFMRDYLHAEFLAGSSGDREVRGVEGDAISNGLDFHIWQPGYIPEWQSPDVIRPVTGASALFTYSDGRAGAVRYAGDHKVVYLGFGLEAVDANESTQIGQHSPIRAELLMRIINWLNVIEHQPRRDVTRTGPQLEVRARLSGTIQDFQAPTLYWRALGDSTFSPVTMMDLGQRHYSAAIVAPDSGRGIEYYLQAAHPYYTWRSPVSAPAALHRYPVPAVIVVGTETMDLGPLAGDSDRRDSSLMVRNLGGTEDSIYVSVDYVNVWPESALTVSPTAFRLQPDSSQSVMVSIYPGLLASQTYNALVLVDSRTGSGTRHFETLVKFSVVATAVSEDGTLPLTYALDQNHPNPFNPWTVLPYQVPASGEVRLAVYDILGREVALLVNEWKAPGRYTARFDGSGLASGVYFARLTAGPYVGTRKMVLIW